MLTFKQAPPLPFRPKRSRPALRSLLAASTLSLMASTAQAVVIIAPTDGVSYGFSPINAFTSGQISENGFTFTSTYGNSVYGYTRGYGLVSNGMWSGGSYIGLNTAFSANQFMTLTFDDPVAAVTAFVNYAPGFGTPYIAVFDAANQLIESTDLTFLTPNGYNAGETLGFLESSDIIKSIRFGDAYIVASNVNTALAAVPVPGTVWLTGLGLALLVFSLRRKKSAGRQPFAVAMAG
jgi:hypothetical protein